jgi:hypothetical protein
MNPGKQPVFVGSTAIIMAALQSCFLQLSGLIAFSGAGAGGMIFQTDFLVIWSFQRETGQIHEQLHGFVPDA